MQEIWKDIKGYEGLYQVSNLGKVKNVKLGKIIKVRCNEQNYLKLDLHKNGAKKAYKVHRLVAEAFIPNPNNYPQINHKDEKKQNNEVTNLEWCTPKYNANYGKRNNKISKKVIQLALSGEIVKIWASQIEAAKSINCCPSSISNCCRGKRNTAGGYHWEYAKEV